MHGEVAFASGRPVAGVADSELQSSKAAAKTRLASAGAGGSWIASL